MIFPRIILILISLTTGSLEAQINPVALGLGGAGASGRNYWSVQTNPAGALGIGKAGFSFAYQPHYLDQSIRTKLLIATFPFKNQLLAGAFRSGGIEEFKTLDLSLMYGREFGESFRMAMQINHHQLRIENYGSAQTVTASLGFQADIAQSLIFGIYLGNLGAVRRHNVNSFTVPSRISAGVSYKMAANVSVLADLEKVIAEKFTLKMGIDYSPVAWLALRAGYQTEPARQSLGLGLYASKLKLDLAAQQDMYLGVNPIMGLSYEF